MESSPPPSDAALPPVVGVKRPASLLPAFEPLTSSPGLPPRPTKRFARESHANASTYPTPVPTSSTAVLTSSPPHASHSRLGQRPGRTHSSVSERAPLSAVPSVMLPKSGEPLKMGRSSGSCNYQLSASRLISRVHVQATFKPANNPFDRDQIEIMCTGWNGIKLHCQGKTYELTKGKTFTSDIKDADVMIDVQDARVLVQWPRPERKDSASAEEDEACTQRHRPSSIQTSPLSSPLGQRQQRLASPISPTPATRQIVPPSSPFISPSHSTQNSVVVYEDEPSSPTRQEARPTSQVTQHASEVDPNLLNSISSSLNKSDEFSDNDEENEENDPIVHSFGPFGENILPRFVSFTAGGSPSRTQREKSSKSIEPPPKPTPVESAAELADKETVRNHAINQLAFSRLSSTPLSTILANLPPGLWKKSAASDKGLSKSQVRSILEGTQCIGEVSREGKDAAGKPLESEYYYIPDFDEDQGRKEAVVNSLMKPGLRNCRKQHKQYFWRKPK